MIITALANFVTGVVCHLGYPGVFLLMMLEATCIPILAEITMPFSGFFVASGQFNFVILIVAGALGSLAGSSISFWIGARGGRPLVERYGRYILLSSRDLERSDNFYQKYGDIAVSFGRFLPVVRIFLSLSAGIARMDYKKFLVYSIIPIIIVDGVLAWAGVLLGQNWTALQPYFHKFDLVIVLLIALAIAWFVWRHLRRKSN